MPGNGALYRTFGSVLAARAEWLMPIERTKSNRAVNRIV